MLDLVINLLLALIGISVFIGVFFFRDEWPGSDWMDLHQEYPFRGELPLKRKLDLWKRSRMGHLKILQRYVTEPSGFSFGRSAPPSRVLFEVEGDGLRVYSFYSAFNRKDILIEKAFFDLVGVERDDAMYRINDPIVFLRSKDGQFNLKLKPKTKEGLDDVLGVFGQDSRDWSSIS